ncbi:MAG: CoA transferase, partial [SAR324 cluster bacterium]|nr:CoA transferase [SAR324 cluster bacterium]
MGPLAGVKVVELAGIGPAPFCAMALSDMGAEVLRVDRTVPSGLGIGLETKYETLKRGRRSVAVDLKNPQSAEVVLRLAEGADALIEGFRPGVMERLGIGPEECLKRNPKLVYGRMTGWGQDGPMAGDVGHDINYIGIGGALGVVGTTDGKPVVPYNIIADYAAGGMQGALGIMAALMARDKTGQGQYVDISMTDGVAYMMAAMASEYFREGTVPGPGAMMLNGGAPYYNVYRCKDGKYISVGCIEPWFWQRLCEALGLEQLVSHQKDESQFPQMLAALEKAFA